MRDVGGDSQQRVLDLGFDDYGRPIIVLAGPGGTTHAIMLESLEPTVAGFCMTCFDEHRDQRHCAARKARACARMVDYLSTLNRDRQLRRRLFAEFERLAGLQTLLVS